VNSYEGYAWSDFVFYFILRKLLKFLRTQDNLININYGVLP